QGLRGADERQHRHLQQAAGRGEGGRRWSIVAREPCDRPWVSLPYPSSTATRRSLTAHLERLRKSAAGSASLEGAAIDAKLGRIEQTVRRVGGRSRRR